MITFEQAVEIYDRCDRHSFGIVAIIEEASKVSITPEMIGEARYELGGGSDAQIWRALACAFRKAGFNVTEVTG